MANGSSYLHWSTLMRFQPEQYLPFPPYLKHVSNIVCVLNSALILCCSGNGIGVGVERAVLDT